MPDTHLPLPPRRAGARELNSLVRLPVTKLVGAASDHNDLPLEDSV